MRHPFLLDLIANAQLTTQAGYGLSVSVIHRSREYASQAKPSTLGSIAAPIFGAYARRLNLAR